MDYTSKNIKNIIVAIIVIVTFLFIDNGMNVNAKDYYTFNDHKMSGGVGQYGNYRRYYYILSSADSYKSKISTAMDEWVHTNYTTSLSFRKTSDRKNSVVDVMATSKIGSHASGVLAWTEFYKHGGGSVNPDKSNWKYTYVKIYKPNFKGKGVSQKGTIAHEFGHCFGLAHNNSKPKSIMCQTAYGRSVSKAQKCDLKGINHLYK